MGNQSIDLPLSADRGRRYDRQNLLVLSAQVITWWSLITLMHREIAPAIKVGIVVLFCLVMQGVFSFMHDCFHGHGHRNRHVNWAAGWLSSTIFGTSYTLFQVNHAGHHVRNRTPSERIDFIEPGESVFRKMAFYYTGIMGGIWLLGLVGALLLPLTPYRAARPLAFQEDSNTYSGAFNDFAREDWNRMRVELALSVGFWAACMVFFGWRWQVLLIMYAAFGFSWSWLQWVYHVRTPIDVVEGAYNLRAPTIVRWLFLNFNYNLTHHRQPAYRWQQLFEVSNQRETQPLWYRAAGIIMPPRPLPDDPSTIRKVYF